MQTNYWESKKESELAPTLFYDRFIERLRDDAVTVGIAFDLQIFPEVPKEPHDAQLDYIITETRILTPNK